MQLKQFKERQVRVRDPIRPGRFGVETRFYAGGAHAIAHSSGTYEADDEGWIEVPPEVAAEIRKSRGPGGERWYAPEEVLEEVGLGRIEESRPSVPTARGPVRVQP